MSEDLSPSERARRGHALFLQRLAHGTAKDVAAEVGVSPPQMSEIKNKQMETCILVLAHLGLKVTPSEYRCVDPSTFEFMTTAAQRLMNKAPALLWDVEG